MPTISDYLQQPVGAGLSPVVGTWVQLTNNVSTTAYVATAATNAAGKYTVNNVPAGTYTVATGPASIGPFTSTGDTSYVVADLPGWYNVKDFGAKGDGSTDDTAAIQATLDACRSGGGGTVYAPPGTYMLSMALRVGGFTSASAVIYGPKTTIMGAGRDATTFKLLASQNGTINLNVGASVFNPYNVSQEQVTFMDFTVDGNAANQTDNHHGIQVWRQRGVKFHRVRIMNTRGTANSGGTAETHPFYLLNSGDIECVDCEVIQTAGTMTNGFTFGGVTNGTLVGCRAISIGAGASIGFGFNAGSGSRQIQYIGCDAYLFGSQGFHIDTSDVKNVTYLGCMAGGTASSVSSAQQYPFTQNQNLGGAGPGFICTVAATGIAYIGCVAENNTGNGFDLRAGEFQLVDCSANSNTNAGFSFSNAPTIRMQGGAAKSNTLYGIQAGTSSDLNAIRITGAPIMSANGTTALRIGSTNYSAPPTNVAAPGVPLTTVALTNQFGFDARVLVTPGASTCAVSLDGVATGVTLASSGVGQMFMVPAGGTITLAYTSNPTWTWFLV